MSSSHENICSQQRDTVSRIFNDNNICNYLLGQLAEFPKIYKLISTYDSVYLYLDMAKYYKFKAESDQEQQGGRRRRINMQQLKGENKYCIRIGKGFPVSSVRLYMLDSSLQPKICDSRDLLSQAIDQPYHHKVRLLDILQAIPEMQSKLFLRNERYLAMQRTGNFHLGDYFYYQQLVEFAGLGLFKNKNDKTTEIIGVSETHILTFKEVKDRSKCHRLANKIHHSQSLLEPTIKTAKNIEEETILNPLVLSSYCNLQCISTIFYNKNQKQIKVQFKKYKSIKLYFQADLITKVYRVLEAEIFLRCILKFISKYQPIEVQFKPKSIRTGSSSEQQQNARIYARIEQASKLQQQLKEASKEEQIKSFVQQIHKKYQKIIQYFSARANPYYLIYVSKLNGLYVKYYLVNDDKK